MDTKLIWKKKLFSGSYTIYSNGQQIGKLKDRSFSQTADGNLNGRAYAFKTKGFFKQHTEIVDRSENRVIGKIQYNTWMTKARISIGNQLINWKYDNLRNTKWSIFDSEGVMVRYTGSSTRGQIDSNTDDALLLLSGLYVTNYYWQSTVAVFIAVFLPIWIAVLN